MKTDGRKSSNEKRNAVISSPNGKLKGSPNGDPRLTSHARDLDLPGLLTALRKMRDGDFSVRLPSGWTGLEGKIADTFNDIVTSNEEGDWGETETPPPAKPTPAGGS